MLDFAYASASDRNSVVVALSDPGTAIIAGGTELLNWMRLGIESPERLVDIGGLHDLEQISSDGQRLIIGARATLNAVAEHEQVRRHAGALAEACLRAASAQVRSRATIGGNVLQKTRCAYFRAEAPLPWGCNKRTPGSGCAARHGLNERHAIFGWTDDCVAVQPSDPAVALACLDAEVQVLGPRGSRTIPMTRFHFTQAEAAAEGMDAATAETRLAMDELIVGYLIPLRDSQRSAYIKVRERASYEYALVSAAASVVLSGDRVVAARIALGSVAQRPWRLPAAEAALVGKQLKPEHVTPSIAAAMAEARPLARNGYKVAMARNAAVRALCAAGGLA